MGTINMLGLAKRVKARILMASTRKVRVCIVLSCEHMWSILMKPR